MQTALTQATIPKRHPLNDMIPATALLVLNIPLRQAEG